MKAAARRLWVNWTLIVVASVSALVVILTRTVWTSAEREARSSHLVVGFRSPEVDRIEVTRAGKRVVIVRDSERLDVAELDDEPGSMADNSAHDHGAHDHARFRVTEPFQGEAEEVAVDGLLRAIELATVVRRVDDATFDRKVAGLDDPQQVIQLDMAKVEVRLRFGNESPSPKGARYVEVAGQGVANRGVYVISQSTTRDLEVSPEAFRIKQLVPYGASTLGKLVLRAASRSPLVLSFDQTHGNWRLNHAGRDVRVSRVAWERLFAAFSRSELERVTDSDVPLEATSDVVEVEFFPRDASLPQSKVIFGGKCQDEPELDRAVKLAPDRVSGCTRALHLDTFVNQPETLVDDRLLSLRTDEIEEVSIVRADKVLELARRESAWVMRRPQEGTVERDVGHSFVQALTTLRGELVDPPAQSAIDVQVTVRTGGDTQESVREQRFEVTPPTAEGVFAHRLDDDVWLRVAPGVHQQLLPFDLLLRQSALTAFEAKELKSVTLITPTWQQRFVVTELGKGCKLEEPTGFDAEPSLCLDVIDALRSLRAQSWVAASPEGSFGLDSPVAKVQWRLQDDTIRTLTVGASAKGGGYYATLEPNGPVFTVSRELVETFTTLVVSHGPFLLDPELLQQVTVQARGRKVELVRLGDEFVLKTRVVGEEAALASSQIQAVVEALSLLKPEAAVELALGRSNGSWSTRSSEDSRAALGLANPLLEVVATQRTPEGAVRTTHFKVGVGDVYRDASVYYAEPVTTEPHALFVLPRASVARVLDALE